MKRHARELETLIAIAEVLNATNDVRSALERTLALVAELLGLTSGWVWLLDAETNQLYSAATLNLPPYLQQPDRMSGTWCLCTDALRSGELMTKNVDVIACSRLQPAVVRRALRSTGGLQYHASISLQFQGRPLGVMNVTGPQWRKLTAQELDLLGAIGLQIGAMIERARLVEDQTRLARAEERTRVARELHDTLLQSLTAIALQLESAVSAPQNGANARLRVERALQTARNAAIEARRAVSGLRATPLGGRPLLQALNGLARSFMSDTGVKVTVDARSGVALGARQESELYRIVQEALTNVQKHAGARAVDITLRRTDGGVSLRITDDGKGIRRTQGEAGHGLQGMEERAALLGGRLIVRRRRGGGTQITATIPADGGRR